MSNKGHKKALRDDIGDGYLAMLDSMRHGVEQAAWGRETSGNLTNDFYRWIGPPEAAPKAIDAAELRGAVEVEPMEGRPSNLEERQAEAAAYARHREAGPLGTIEMENAHDDEWREFSAWIDGRSQALGGREQTLEHESNGPELGD